MDPKDKPNDKPNEPAQPQYVTVDQFNAVNAALQNLTTQLGQFHSRIDVLATPRREEPGAVAPASTFQRTVSQADIDKAYDDGDYKRAGQLQSTFIQETIKESTLATQSQIAQLQTTGMTMIANVVGTQAKDKLPYYTRFKDQIDKMLEKVSPDLRANPEMHKWAHDAVVGQNVEIITKEASEGAVRKALDGGAGYVPGQSGTPTHKDGQLTPEAAYGSDWGDIQRLLKAKNITIEEHARRLGHSDVQAYLKKVKQSREQEAANG